MTEPTSFDVHEAKSSLSPMMDRTATRRFADRDFQTEHNGMMIRPRAADDPSKEDGGKGTGGDDGRGSGTAVITRTRTQTRKPGMFRVLLLNDDYTPMEFVVVVLRKFFSKGLEEAHNIMLHVHQHGVGECGVFTYEVAETKVTQVMDYARKQQHPLQCIMEKK